jgi:hypothetical protein
VVAPGAGVCVVTASRAIRPLRLRSASAAARTVEDPVLAYVTAYRPQRVANDRWEGAAGNFVVEQILRLNIGLEVAKSLTRMLAYLVDWSLDERIPLEVDRVLDPDTVTRYVDGGYRGSASAKATVRAQLRRLGRALATGAPWEPPPDAYGRTKAPVPYSAAELALIERDCRRQGTESLRHAARVVVALGAGVGLDGRWNTKIDVTDVRRRKGSVEVSVPSPNSRLVVVRHRYADEILQLAAAAGRGPLVGRLTNHKNAASRIVNDVVVDQGRLPLVPGRLRSNWLVALLEVPTQIPVLLEAAGLKGFGNLEDLLPYVGRVPDARARQQLGDA